MHPLIEALNKLPFSQRLFIIQHLKENAYRTSLLYHNGQKKRTFKDWYNEHYK